MQKFLVYIFLGSIILFHLLSSMYFLQMILLQQVPGLIAHIVVLADFGLAYPLWCKMLLKRRPFSPPIFALVAMLGYGLPALPLVFLLGAEVLAVLTLPFGGVASITIFQVLPLGLFLLWLLAWSLCQKAQGSGGRSQKFNLQQIFIIFFPAFTGILWPATGLAPDNILFFGGLILVGFPVYVALFCRWGLGEASIRPALFYFALNLLPLLFLLNALWLELSKPWPLPKDFGMMLGLSLLAGMLFLLMWLTSAVIYRWMKKRA